MSFTPKHLGHLVLRVRNLERSVDFYTRVMGLKVMDRGSRGNVFLSANPNKSHELALSAIGGPDFTGPDSNQVGLIHMAWQMETYEDLQEIYNRARALDVKLNVDHYGDHGTTMGFYFFDPDGIEVECYYEMPKDQWPADGKLFSGKRGLLPKLEEPAGATKS